MFSPTSQTSRVCQGTNNICRLPRSCQKLGSNIWLSKCRIAEFAYERFNCLIYKDNRIFSDLRKSPYHNLTPYSISWRCCLDSKNKRPSLLLYILHRDKLGYELLQFCQVKSSPVTLSIQSMRSLLFYRSLFITAYSYNFKKLPRIKTVHSVSIFKNVSHLVTDYAGATNFSVDIGMRMPVNPDIDTQDRTNLR